LYTDSTESAPMGNVAGRQQHRETGATATRRSPLPTTW
jgi:hypothetical protein